MDEKGNDKEEFIEKINISSELKNNNEKKVEGYPNTGTVRSSALTITKPSCRSALNT